MTAKRLEYGLLALVVISYLLLGVGYATRTADWQNPDEPAHYNYVAQIVFNGCCPVIRSEDWNQTYLSELTSTRFNPELLGGLNGIQYEDHQPPLYYMFSAVIFRLSNGSLLALRLFSVVLGAGVIVTAYGVARLLLPNRPQIAIATAAFVAFVPQHIAMLAAVNNDALAELLIALTLLATVAYLKYDRPPLPRDIRTPITVLLAFAVLTSFSNDDDFFINVAVASGILIAGLVADYTVKGKLVNETWLLGTLVGLIFLTKATGYFLAGVVPLMILLKWWFVERHADETAETEVADADGDPDINTDTIVADRPTTAPRPLLSYFNVPPLPALALYLIPALGLGAIWWYRNNVVYEGFDILGLVRHSQVVFDQPRTAALIRDSGLGDYIPFALTTTFNSFWGQFGWMALPLPGLLYTVLLLFCVAAIGGLVVDRVDLRGQSPASVPVGQRLAWLTMILTVVLVLVQFVFYNSEFLQLQGRYLFPALIPLGIWVAAGLDAWRRWFFKRDGLLNWLPVAVIALLIPLNLWILWRVIPGLQP